MGKWAAREKQSHAVQKAISIFGWASMYQRSTTKDEW
jgi:hypothetical protein